MSDDPFDDLSADDDSSDDAEDPFEGLGERDDDPFDDLAEDQPAASDTDEEWASNEESLFNDAVDPTGDSGGGVGTAEDDPFEGFERPESDPFTDLDAGDSDLDDTVWDDLSVDPEVESLAEQREGRTVSDVSKHRFCERCPHFTGPPESRCTHEGTEIQEFLDMETVRVVDCPIVEEREAIGDIEHAGTE